MPVDILLRWHGWPRSPRPDRHALAARVVADHARARRLRAVLGIVLGSLAALALACAAGRLSTAIVAGVGPAGGAGHDRAPPAHGAGRSAGGRRGGRRAARPDPDPRSLAGARSGPAGVRGPLGVPVGGCARRGRPRAVVRPRHIWGDWSLHLGDHRRVRLRGQLPTRPPALRRAAAHLPLPDVGHRRRDGAARHEPAGRAAGPELRAVRARVARDLGVRAPADRQARGGDAGRRAVRGGRRPRLVADGGRGGARADWLRALLDQPWDRKLQEARNVQVAERVLRLLAAAALDALRLPARHAGAGLPPSRARGVAACGRSCSRGWSRACCRPRASARCWRSRS